jgi:FixJ family two-component response regulator
MGEPSCRSIFLWSRMMTACATPNDRTLRAAGYVVSVFPDYRGVMDMLDKGAEAHLLLVDILLPGGTPHGVSVAAMARHRRLGLPVLFVTGYADYARHVVDGAVVLVKPVADTMLLATVAKMMAEQCPGAWLPLETPQMTSSQ